MSQDKTASLGEHLGRLAGRMGSSPTSWIPKGGPLTGSLVQSALLGLGGYGAGRLAGYFMPKIDAHRLGIVAGLGSAAVPWAVHRPAFGQNLREWREGGQPWYQDPLAFLRTMNQSYQKQGSFEKAAFQVSTPSNLPAGFGIPVAHTMGMIRTDPLLSPIQKMKALSIVEAAQPKRTGIVSWPTVTRAAVGAGLGFTSAALFGKALDTLFGGLSAPTQRKLQGAGTIAGILLNTGAIR